MDITLVGIKKMSQIWKSEVPKSTKNAFFRPAVDGILRYGCENWMLANKLSKKLDRTYTRLLQTATNTS